MRQVRMISLSPGKFKKNIFKNLQTQSGEDRNSTRASTKKVMEEALKENQAKTSRRRVEKKGLQLRKMYNLRMYLIPKEGKLRKTLMMILRWELCCSLRKPYLCSTGGRIQKSIAKKPAKKASKKSFLTGSKRKQKKVPLEEEPNVAAESSKQRKQGQVKDQWLSDLVPFPWLLAQRDAEIACLKAALQQASIVPIEEPVPMVALHQENEELKLKMWDLTKRIIQAHNATN
ncbi:hypothetical protein HAX54_009634 [Datura stramonium]|uniref:Uncharacterized protein n=1 Tax=Datura stramonium TaxID=4076 RepID=A0ABS8TF71_DATST|nr:hypothetical protein [Datura stramonium]